MIISVKHKKIKLRPLVASAILASGICSSAWSAEVNMTVENSWAGGFQGGIAILNNESSAINGWELTFCTEFEIIQVWNADISSSGNCHTVNSLSWNANISVGQQVNFGFNASFNGSIATPTDFQVNGAGTATSTPEPSATPTPTPTPTGTPTPSPIPTFDPTPSPPPSGVAIPGRVEVENYTNFFDTTSGNEGTAFRSDDVDIETTLDNDGEFNVGWIDTGEWLEFSVSVSQSGNYSANARVASMPGGGMMTLEIDGVTVGNAFEIGNTGGWQSWTTLSQPLGLISSGQHTLRVQVQAGSFNLNWIDLLEDGVQTPTPTASPTPTPPPPPTEAAALCIFDYDLTLSSNKCGATEGNPNYSCRVNGSSCPTFGWFEQCLAVNARDAIAECVARGAFIGIASHADVNGCWNDKVVPVPQQNQFPELTGSSRYNNPGAAGFSYPAIDERSNWNCPDCAYHMSPGTFKPDMIASIMRHYGMNPGSAEDRANVIFWDDSTGNIGDVRGAMSEVNSILIPRNNVSGDNGGCGIRQSDINAGWDALPNHTPLPSQSPTPGVAIPGVVQAENYTNAFDTTAGNEGGDLRSDDVDVEETLDSGGGHNVGWIDAGEWLEFNVNVSQSANYTANVRVASKLGGGMMTLEVDGAAVGNAFEIGATGGWQSWETMSQFLGPISSGEHTLRVQVQSGSFNLNWLDLQAGGTPTPTPEPSVACSNFGSGVSVGRTASSVGTEVSGLISSRQMPHVLWVHNDSGDTARIYAINTNGGHVATVTIAGAGANDYEDIAIDAQNRIYVGDIGDNQKARGSIQVYRFAEPVGASGSIQVSAERITLNYPDGAHNAETLMVDPISGDLFVLTKTSGTSVLYRAAAPLGSNVNLQAVHTFDFNTELTTAGEISPSGDLIVVRTYGNVYAWRRAPGTSVAEAMRGPRLNWPARSEQQGEAIGFAADGSGYFTISEGNTQPVYFYPCTD
ncbi:MAG: hypothetical protein COA42_04725 [Alteromonadaceae bacterium]|nr:MAG: hypothetical protein COA42_04725 [Alteromonadaceae bacterium]